MPASVLSEAGFVALDCALLDAVFDAIPAVSRAVGYLANPTGGHEKAARIAPELSELPHACTASIGDLTFLSCLCGSELGHGIKPDHRHFLSCLCGSEHAPGAAIEPLAFLSCLCGSEPDAIAPGAGRAFLSCLCGSEHSGARRPSLETFLSCLCGSELPAHHRAHAMSFLSCLCGSEQAAGPEPVA